MIRTILLDYGRVLAYPRTGNWFIPPNFYRILGPSNILKCILRRKELLDAYSKATKYLDDNHILHTEEEELAQFTVFYKMILDEVGIVRNMNSLSERLAWDSVYNSKKVDLYADVKEYLKYIFEHFDAYILSDTWPSINRVLEYYDISGYLKGVVRSCDHGICKDNVRLFMIAIDRLQLIPTQTAFVDDHIGNLENAERAGFFPILMDRTRKSKEWKYPISYCLKDVIDIIEKENTANR